MVSISKRYYSFNHIPRKNFHIQHSKYLKWFFRDVEFNFDNGSRFKQFEFKRYKDSNRIELIPFKEEYNSVLIWLYAGDFVDQTIYQLLEYNNFPAKAMKIVVLTAPFNPIGYCRNILQHNWFDIMDLPDSLGNRFIDKAEIAKQTKDIIFPEINHQYTLVGSHKNIFIGGFSQSACMAIHAGLSYPETIGGVVSFAGFRFDFSPIDQDRIGLPIIACNGLNDDIVMVNHAKNSFQGLINLGFNVKLIVENGMYHAFSRTSLEYATEFLAEQTAKDKQKINKFI